MSAKKKTPPVKKDKIDYSVIITEISQGDWKIEREKSNVYRLLHLNVDRTEKVGTVYMNCWDQPEVMFNPMIVVNADDLRDISLLLCELNKQVEAQKQVHA